ncbi:MAG: hypothetical protein WBW32_06930 [Luteibacter sp.]
MTIKEQAYRAHAFLRARCVTTLKRSHVHELLAAAVGYDTHAAFQHDATWCDVPFSITGTDPDPDVIRSRCRELGLRADETGRVVEGLPIFLHDAGYAPVRFDALIAAVESDDEDSDWDQWVWTHVVEPAGGSLDFYFDDQRLLLEGLEAAAQRGAPAAHLAIAKLLESEAVGFGYEDERVRRQVRRDGTWTSPFVSFVDVESNGLRVEGKHRHHLLASARGGDIRALMETAERYGDPAVLERAPSSETNPMTMVEIAGEHGDGAKVRYWLTVAAQEGNFDAMRELILDHDEPDEQAWVWMHLSRLLDYDLSQDRYEAINEDGTPYDDDVGGPAYVGGDEGIDLNPLPRGADAVARNTAELLFVRINVERDRS